jgi:hypothetical protein
VTQRWRVRAAVVGCHSAWEARQECNSIGGIHPEEVEGRGQNHHVRVVGLLDLGQRVGGHDHVTGGKRLFARRRIDGQEGLRILPTAEQFEEINDDAAIDGRTDGLWGYTTTFDGVPGVPSLDIRANR